MTECQVPTEEYNAARTADLAMRHLDLSPGLLEHLEVLEPFLERSISAGFSLGFEKAQVVVQEGSLLGHHAGQEGSSHEPGKTEAIDNFAPLKGVSQVRQFVGSTNWVRGYLFACCATAIKMLSEYMKPAAVFPPQGLGAGESACSCCAGTPYTCLR